ncbi:MAG: hypothetical protein EBZ59_12145, partial [Planctomycetia bacterium]|nr:hypothetical protein [Planctomycetia bacterium]
MSADHGNAVGETNGSGTGETNNSREFTRAAAVVSPLAISAVGPAGALAGIGTATGAIDFAGDFDVHSAALVAGQTFAIGLVPTGATLRLRATLLAADGTVVGEATAATAGARVRIQPVAIAAAGTYRLRVEAVEGSGSYSLVAAANA